MFYNLNRNFHACCILEPAEKCCPLDTNKCDVKSFDCESKKGQCKSSTDVKDKCPVTCKAQNCVVQGKLDKRSCQ